MRRPRQSRLVLPRFRAVPDLDAWWQAVSQLQLDQRYPGFRIEPPTDFPWGREVNFIDLAGVCWHVGQPGARALRVGGLLVSVEAGARV